MKKYIARAVLFLFLIHFAFIHMTLREVKAASQAEDLVSVAKGQVGVKERSSNSDDIFYNDWYYGRRVNNNGAAGKYAWCAVFVSWCAEQAGIPHNIIPKTANTRNMKNMLINAGGIGHLKGSGYVPQRGDIIFFGSDAKDHVGIVEYSSQNRVYYVDGNNTQTNPHGVHYSNCSLSYSSLWGFVTPNYSGLSCSCSEQYKGNYIVTTNQYSLTIRSGHGTSYAQVTTIPKGAQVYVSKANGTWAHVEWNGYRGYCSIQYLTKIQKDTTAPTITNAVIESVDANGYTVCVTASDNVGVTSVSCATWTQGGGQDDLHWREMTLQNNTARIYIPFGDHGNQVDCYHNHVYAYDAAGNQEFAAVDYARCEDIGTGFYARIYNPAINRVVANQNSNAVSSKDTTSVKSLWKFEKQSDNSYKIISCLDGKVLDVENAGQARGTNIVCYDSHNGRNQRWYISKNGSGYSLMPACAQGKALDIFDLSTKEGANIGLFDWGNRDTATIFRFDRVNDVSVYGGKVKQASLHNSEAFRGECTSFQTGEALYFYVGCENADKVEIKIYRNNKMIFQNTLTAGKKYKYANLQEGNHRIEFTPVNGTALRGKTLTKNFTVKTIDAIAPSVTQTVIETVDAKGYTVYVKASDNVGITSLKCATWTRSGGQDDIVWREMKLQNGAARIYIPFAEHRNQVDYYCNHVYAYDAAGNHGFAAVDYTRCEDIGTEFYARIYNPAINRAVANKDKNVVSSRDTASAKSLWKFEKQKDNSYKIISCLDGRVLDVENGGQVRGTNVLCHESKNGSNQRWYISRNGNGYSLVPACAKGKALDIFDLSTKEGANIGLYDWGNKDTATIFRFDKVSDVSTYAGKMKQAMVSRNTFYQKECKEFLAGETIYLLADCENAEKVQISIYHGSRQIFRNTLETGKYKYPGLTEGNYRIEFTPVNFAGISGKMVTKTFIVKKADSEKQPAAPEESDHRDGSKNAEQPESYDKEDGNSKKDETHLDGKEKKPDKVSDFRTKKPTVNTITLSWDRVKNAHGYEIYRYKNNAKKADGKITIAKNQKNTYTDKKLKSGTHYQYRIRSYYVRNGKKIYSNYSAKISGITVLSTPQVKLKKAAKSGQAILTWKKVNGASGYEIYRATSKNGKYKKIATVKKNSAKTTYKDRKLEKNKKYYYKVRAYKTVNKYKAYSKFSVKYLKF